MGNETTRIVMEAVLKKALREVPESPERSARNLVDLALNFADGHFQRQFLKVARTMLRDEQSPYFALLADTVAHVSQKQLIGFGMNLGYNSCTAGVRTIRAISAQERCCIPWTLTLQMHRQWESHQQRYQSILSQGEALGIYSWLLMPDGCPDSLFSLIESHPDSAFLLFCKPQDITPTFLDCAAQLNNLMLCVQDGDQIADACAQLRARKLLYTVNVVYSEQNAAEITSGTLFDQTASLHPIFTTLRPAPDCCPETQAAVYERVKQIRKQNRFRTIPWELLEDGSYVNHVILKEAKMAGFSADGSLYTQQTVYHANLFKQDLLQILKAAFPQHESNPPQQ